MIAVVLVIGGVFYFGFREFVQIENQLASLLEQVTPLLEEPMGLAPISTPTTTSTFDGFVVSSEPEEPEKEVNP